MADSSTRKPATIIQSVSRAAKILLAIATSEASLSPKEISKQFGLTLPTTYHLLATLEMEGLIARDATRAYSLGPAATVIADAIGHDYVIPEAHIRGLHDLATATGEAVYLSGWQRGTIRVLAVVEGTHIVGVSSLKVGYSGNLHARASGKLLIAFANDQLRERVVSNLDWVPLTDKTITSPDAFESELAAIREERISRDRGEFAEGVECVSAPITVSGAVVACYTVSVPTARFEKVEAEVVRALRVAAEEASS